MDRLHRILAGRYRILDVLGRGGMSTVYRADDLVLGRTVAIKVLAPALAEGDPVWVARFEREARAAAALTHSGVATVYDTGVVDGTRFIVMELVAGRSLAEVLRTEAPLDPQRAVRVAAQVADVLSAAHAAGIVHRDVKPANVMLAADDSVKVLDFGIARALNGTVLTQTVSVVGTAAYMSPEQALGKPAEERSDIYALGCVLYAMLAGGPPFTGEVAAAVLHQHVHVDPRPLGDVAPLVPASVAALVSQMLSKAPAARPGSAAEVRRRLLGSMGASETAATRVLAPSIGPRRRRPGAVAVVVGLLALVIAGIAFALGSSGGRAGLSPTGSSTTRAPSALSTSGPARTAAPARTRSVSSTVPSLATTTDTSPSQAPAAPPGHGGVPPGKAKKHDKKHGDGGGPKPEH